MQEQPPTPKKQRAQQQQQNQLINPSSTNARHASKPNWQEVQQQLTEEGWQIATPCHPTPKPDPCKPYAHPHKPCNCKDAPCNCHDKKHEHAGGGVWFASWGLLGLASLLFLLSLLNSFFRPVISITVPPTQVTTRDIHHEYKEVTPIPPAPSPVPESRLW